MDRALRAFAAALGPGGVLTGEDELRELRDPYVFAAWQGQDRGGEWSKRGRVPAAVLPATVEQVQAVVRVAGEHGVPLWTFSQGRNAPYGGPAAPSPGCVLVSLRRMDRVLEVNEELAYAVVEPGVRFFDLYEHLRAAGSRLWVSVPDLGWGSVLGNALDHGVGFTPHGDHASHLCGLEVVLAGGEVLRTGMGALTGSRSWHVHRRGFGPSADGLFMQSGLGIVTRAGVWLMPEPECYAPCWASVPGEADLEVLIDVLRDLVVDRTIANHPLVGGRPGGGRPPGRWFARFALYGPEAVVEARYAVVERAFARVPGAVVTCRRYAGAEVAGIEDPEEQVQAGVPNMHMMEVVRAAAGEHGGHLDLSPVAPLRGREVTRLRAVVGALAERHGLPYGPAFIVTPRCVVHIYPIMFDTRDERQVRAAHDLYAEAVPALAREGFGLYRAHVRFMDLAAEQYDFGAGALRRFQRTLKAALDPQGILSPGKSGV